MTIMAIACLRCVVLQRCEFQNVTVLFKMSGHYIYRQALTCQSCTVLSVYRDKVLYPSNNRSLTYNYCNNLESVLWEL